MFMLRILLAWLLIAAMPMQGFAAASMLLCGMGAQHQHTAEASEPHDHAAVHGHGGDADHTCSICAACCNGVALVGLSHLAAAAPAPQAEWAEPFVLIHTLPTPVPDKPPRA